MNNIRFVLLAGCLVVTIGCSRQKVAVFETDAASGDPAKAKESKRNGPDKDQAKAEVVGDGFPFPSDQGGVLLAKLLAPASRHTASSDRSGPRRFPAAPALEKPSVPLPANQADVVRLPNEKAAGLTQPGKVPEGLPLGSYLGTAPLPEAQQLPVGQRVRLPGVDVNRPLPLPPLAQAVPDRAPLDDPTTEASQAAALAGSLPQRSIPAPFLRLNLPDPFENRITVRLRTALPEDGIPVAASPRTPKQ